MDEWRDGYLYYRCCKILVLLGCNDVTISQVILEAKYTMLPYFGSTPRDTFPCYQSAMEIVQGRFPERIATIVYQCIVMLVE